jgi:hypothetical protein
LADPKTRKARIEELLEQARHERELVEAQRAQMIAEHLQHLERTGSVSPVAQIGPVMS